MREAGIGRVLVASLHQGIADILPTRLGFYENWLNAEGLREGTIGLAPLYAVLSFLRQEGDAYQLITTRAGEYAAEWTVQSMRPFHRAAIKAAPVWLRSRILLRMASTARSSNAAAARSRGCGDRQHRSARPSSALSASRCRRRCVVSRRLHAPVRAVQPLPRRRARLPRTGGDSAPERAIPKECRRRPRGGEARLRRALCCPLRAAGACAVPASLAAVFVPRFAAPFDNAAGTTHFGWRRRPSC